MLKQVYAALIFTALITVYDAQRFNFTRFVLNYNVTKFMNTTMEIWTYNTTSTSHRECLVDNVVNITTEEVFFNRSYRESGNWSQSLKKGTFEAKDPSLMIVGPPDMMADDSETLEYADNNYTCGIFRVRAAFSRGGWYDLRFKTSGRPAKPEKPGQECLDRFQKTHPGSHLVYYYNCTSFQG
ncbi:uncharacterized protein LOC119402101 isoform X2 [Rhipicephalus sanguineus]|uniref:uncharacterized protein LOC119402101 isoform X2 n=1 Tax=Rhipicephalus sanguineus TaxID=34632 RepID=UPI0018949B7A|nr:uncharacterized protein LOC119402101 isoform X2 [Rhipicephalus sanguineus]